MTHLPSSTYRIQINSSFRLKDLEKIVDYLSQLGITTIYAAPFFRSRSGSVHGYDVTNPLLINHEIGTLGEFENICHLLKERNMGWLQDIVPNHMAFDGDNAWLMDIFEKGKHSDYWSFFDIDWNSEEEDLKGKIIAPFLGTELDEVLKKGELKIQHTQKGFYLNYYALQYPLSWKSYYDILALAKEFCEARKERNEEAYNHFQHLVEDFKTIQNNFDDSFDANNSLHLKELTYQYTISYPLIKQALEHSLEQINKDPEELKSILNDQFFRLAYWKTTESKINYRRFFTVNDLICLRMENDQVFDRYHQFIKTLLDQGLIQGLRIDHVDGLYDPSGYLEKLRKLVGQDVYVIVEKILESEEELPDFWPIQGTSGYEFLSCVNRLFTKEENKDQFTEIYQNFTEINPHYEDLIFEKKLFILNEKMGGELNNLVKLMEDLKVLPQVWIEAESPGDANKRLEERRERFKAALAVVLAAFPVYRIYNTQLPLDEISMKVIEHAFEQAEKNLPDLKEEIQTIRSIMTGKGENKEVSANKLKFLMRSQQFTGPLAAKGVEDTVFYLYNRLISHNEVGDSAHLFGMPVEAFHERMKERKEKMPLSINATATHDTKRGEDARARINALSEIPEEWTYAIFDWKEINKKHKTILEDKPAPDDNDEYFIYQAIVGSLPMEGQADEEFRQRLKDYMLKAIREAKVNSDWSEPNTEYENAVTDFVERILTDPEFLSSFAPLFDKVKAYGILNSLSQTLIKITAPGIPDTYQGGELWDLSFVDPDNRRPVDFVLRQRYLNEILKEKDLDRERFVKSLIESKEDGKIKLFTLSQALKECKSRKDLFLKGEYIPLTFTGERSNQVVGYARRYRDQWCMVIVPKEVTSLISDTDFGTGKEVWKSTRLTLPPDAPREWQNMFTSKLTNAKQTEVQVTKEQLAGFQNQTRISPTELVSFEDQLMLAELLEDFPVAMLVGNE